MEEYMGEDLKKRRTEKSEAGFTLMELVVVLVILGLLAAVVGPTVYKRMMGSRDQIAKIQISQLEGALNLYAFDMGRYPSSSDGLQALVQNPSGSSSWKGPYLEKGVPLDPWDKTYIYRNPGTHGGDFDICSAGADGIEGTDDDICN